MANLSMGVVTMMGKWGDLAPLNIPAVMQLQRQWLLWMKEFRKGKPTKVPYSVYGGMGKTNDPKTWGSFNECISAVPRFDGIGFVFAEGDQLVGIDLDKCVDVYGVPSDDALEIIDKFKGKAFIEKSPSKTGFHIYCLGRAHHCGKGQGDKKWVEVYDYHSPRYFTVTGDAWFGQCEPQDCQTELDWLHEKYTKRVSKKTSVPRVVHTVSLNDSEILLKARRRSEFDNLYSVGASPTDDHSSMDLALCNSLAFWFQCDANRMDRVFRTSALMRDKWDRNAGNGQTYGERTIERAIRDCVETYDPMRAKSARLSLSPSNLSPSPQIYDEGEFTDKQLCQGSSDEGNAQTTLLLYGSQFAYTEAYGWMQYNGSHWNRKGAEAKLDRAIISTLLLRREAADRLGNDAVHKKAKPSTANVKSTKYLLTSLVYRDIEDYDGDKDLLNCVNGVVNLQTGDIKPHSSDQKFTYCLKSQYKPDASYKIWEDFLLSVVEGQSHEEKQEMVEYLQLSVGYSLTGYTSEEVLWYVFGPSRSGKGTYTETLMSLLGSPLATEVEFGTFSADRENDANNFDLAPLKPVRAIFASESNKHQKLNAAKVKALTGGNQVRCCFKHKDHFTYQPQYKIWLTSNNPPNADVDDKALWGRLRVLTFPHSRLGEEDKGLKSKMQHPEVLEGVLAWAVEGAKKWYQNRNTGLKTPQRIMESTEAIRKEQDNIAQWLEECITRDPDEKLPNKDAYESYKDWCEDNGATPKKKKAFTAGMQLRGIQGPTPVWYAGKTTRCWEGITF